jgi:hypothetical protein
MSRIFAEVIGQIMSQLVKKSVSTTVLPLSEASEKLLPLASTSGMLRIDAGIGASRIVPPIIAAVPVIGGGVGAAIFIPAIEPDVELGLGVAASEALDPRMRSDPTSTAMLRFMRDLP